MAPVVPAPSLETRMSPLASTATESGVASAGPEPRPPPEIRVRAPVFGLTSTTSGTKPVKPSSVTTMFPSGRNAMSLGASSWGRPVGEEFVVSVL